MRSIAALPKDPRNLGRGTLRLFIALTRDVIMQPISIFDDGWIKKAKNQAGDSWVSEVVADLEGTGAAYLNTLRMWFERFPIQSANEKTPA